jgi:mono/diheme cytochrome c family protein
MDVPHLRAKSWRPALALVVIALIPAVAGAVILVQARRERVVRETLVDGLFLRLESSEWLHDGMDHSGSGFQMPSSMAPGMPIEGQTRLSVEVSVTNTDRQAHSFHAEELELRSSNGAVWPSLSSEVEAITLAPGEIVNSILQFDVPQTLPGVRLVWAHAGIETGLLSTRPADHLAKPAPPRPDKWPQNVAGLPPGNAVTGEKLFLTSYGCIACHGDPRTPNSNMVAPHLGNIGAIAQQRVAGVSASQYIYDSILYPNRFVAPNCAHDLPCVTPSVMPSYGDVLPLQEMSDLVAYLSQLMSAQSLSLKPTRGGP